MSDESKPNIDPETPVIKILTQIRNEEISPKDLPKEIRLECVEYLWLTDTQPVAIIANALNVSEKTIRRDQDDIRKRRAKQPSTDYSMEVFGELLEKARSAHENMMRLARSSEGSIQEKAQAGFYAWKMIQQQIEIAQSLGVAPSQALKIEASVRQEEGTTPAQLKEELARLEGILNAKGIIDPKIAELVENVKGQTALAEAKAGIMEIKARIDEIEKGQVTHEC